ncbi:TIGR04219 family outer membrane beta-barrel protein [Marinibactrum halimedae]|uniref:Membrane protein n=1 Tax=Marinibactrum halimedae TaxID=1444977 RepID=A0AA37T5A0_9GAMM|nr:TIGR04219 family outer membrane beta-barrel protein [Marinibactrum halimedae]MCD9459401.1 TIGR04219 family outer membrane beta-barrel protein [Marinibactrum halimedae]GLS27533.1 membrane protein [Marinibactrum halimedae]
MKSSTLSFALAGALCSLSWVSQADTILGIYAGVGAWNSDYSGNTGVQSIEVEDLGLDDETNNFFYVALEHPVPLLPNVRLQYTDLTIDADTVLTQTFQLDDVTFSVDENVATSLDFTHADATLYYEILDNWVSLDVGVTFRAFTGEAEVTGDTAGTETIDLDAVIPMAYGKAQFDLPFSGFYVGADANLISYSGHSLNDFTAKIGYAYESVLDAGVEIGYRRMALELDDLDDLNADLTMDGPYAAFTLHF